MPITVWIRITAGDVAEAVKDHVADVNADIPQSFRPGSVVDRVAGGVDWAAAGKRAGEIAAKGIGSAASMLRVGGPMIIMTIAEWFLDGALAMLDTEAGKPAADALAKLGDAWLDVMAQAIAPLIPILLRAIKAIFPAIE